MNRASRRRQGAKGASPVAQQNRQPGPGADAAGKHLQQALQLHQAGRRDEAERLYREVLAASPGHPGAQHFLGLLLHQAGQGEAGLELLGRSVSAEPRNADFLNNLGAVLRDLGRVEESAEIYRKAVAARPDHAEARNNLGLAQKELGQFEAAADTFRALIAVKPFYAVARRNLGDTLREAGRPDAAVEAYREGLALRPNDAEITYGLAIALMEKGRIADAIDALRRAVSFKPDHAEAWMLLATLKKQQQPDAELESMQALHARAGAGSRERMLLSFGLGKAHGDLGEYERAFDFFLEGNATRRRGFEYDAADTRAEFEAMKTTFDAGLFERYAGSGAVDDTPIFLVGMPRSGTTLVEQIIASHPAVYGAGELELLKTVIDQAFSGRVRGEFPGSIATASLRSFAEAGQAYVADLRARFPGYRHVTDKMPGNFLLVGLIHLILPKARIIHCVRDARATCLSIYTTNFRSEGHRYGYDLAELADFHNMYRDIMAHWHRVLPGVVHDIRYEDLVLDQEGQTRALIDYLDLPWDDACLAFHETERPVRTASAGQVRRPMYKGSIDLWQRYGDRLKPLLESLD